MIWQVVEGQQGGGFPFQWKQQTYCLVHSGKLLPALQNFPNLQAGFLGVGNCCFLEWIHYSLPPPGLRNTVRAQQISCNSFLGLCQVPLPTKAGMMLYPPQNFPHTAPWFRSSALFCIYSWVLIPTKIQVKWTSTEWVLVWRIGGRRRGSETKKLASRQGTGLPYAWEAAFASEW